MEQNHIAPESAFTPEAAAAPVSFVSPGPAPAEAYAFAGEAEEAAYWAGVSDGIRNQGGMPAPRLAARARDEYPELVATADELRDRDILDFDAVSVRHRIDGWTPAKQREYVEALADSGVARYAAARVGMSEQSANRLRRRSDARSFDRACEAAVRIGARRLVSVAFERAIEGTVRRHHYHGEVKSEERVYDNRLLIALISKLGHLVAPPEEVAPVLADWEPWMDAVEQGLPEATARISEAPPSASPEDPALETEDGWTGMEVWEDDDGTWWTEFPPPQGFEGEEEGDYGDANYRRTLSADEQRVIDADEAEEQAEELAQECARRDLYFGFAGDAPETEVFLPMGPEPYETSDPSAEAVPAEEMLAARVSADEEPEGEGRSSS